MRLHASLVTVALLLTRLLVGRGMLRIMRSRGPALLRRGLAVQKDSLYITTPIYYVNGQPHLGHAYTSVISDVIARYNRAVGKDVYFLTGTDEHGQKVEQSAHTAKQTPLELADTVSAKFKELTASLGCSNDDFIRTTEDRHKAAVAALWIQLEKEGHIYLGAYEGWYSVRDEAFYSASELVDGKAPTGADVQWVKEESYFFRLSQWTEKLLKFYEDNPSFIAPKTRRNEVVSFVSQEGGLRDLSISRTTFNWGVPVPGNPQHVIYVWLDALTNYISALGYPNKEGRFSQFWPANVHIVGKDILRFHAVYWPAFLMAAGLEAPKRIFAHGWWTKDGEKMSKSVGNVLDPFELIKAYGVDYLRYFLCTEIHLGNDGDFSHEFFRQRINAELSNDLGNLVQRVAVMIQKHCNHAVPAPAVLTDADRALLEAARSAGTVICQQLEQQGVKSICEIAINLAKLGNRYIDAEAPWKLAKRGENDRLATVLYVLVELLRSTTVYIEPVMPASAQKIFAQIGVPEDQRSYTSLRQELRPGMRIAQIQPVFPRLEAPETETVVEGNKTTSVKASKKTSDPVVLKFLADKYAAVTAVGVLEEALKTVGEDVRRLKAEKADKKEVQQALDELFFLKEKLSKAR